MPYLVKLTTAQLWSLRQWAQSGAAMGDVLIDVDGEKHPGRLIVAQGDCRAYIDPDGTIIDTEEAAA